MVTESDGVSKLLWVTIDITRSTSGKVGWSNETSASTRNSDLQVKIKGMRPLKALESKSSHKACFRKDGHRDGSHKSALPNGVPIPLKILKEQMTKLRSLTAARKMRHPSQGLYSYHSTVAVIMSPLSDDLRGVVADYN